MPSPIPTITVCIPAYNRAELLPALMDSIFKSSSIDFDVLIAEDHSPERAKIAEIAQYYAERFPNRVHYHENQKNLGYDGNLRCLISLAKGKYCLFMGNDDLLGDRAIEHLIEILQRNPDCGAVIRSYASFEGDSRNIKQIFRYFPGEIILSPGVEAISVAYRRAVVISGITIQREIAQSLETQDMDGTLLYQLYLVGMIAAQRSIIFTPEILALRRDGNVPDFGHSEAEKGKFTPKEITPLSSVQFISGLLWVAREVENRTGCKVYKNIEKDIGLYSYPLLSIQGHRPLFIFLDYAWRLSRLGLWKYLHFYLYFIVLVCLGPKKADMIIGWIKTSLGYTPRFGAARRLNK